MAREKREKKLYSFYHIKQTCQSNLGIFKEDEDRKILIEAFMTAKEKHNFKLMGIAIFPNGYEMILFDNGSDISKIMKSINISFAMKFKCHHENCGIVFKERYKSEIISKEDVKQRVEKLPICKYLKAEWIDQVDVNECKDKGCIDCLDQAKENLQLMTEDIGLTYEEMLKKKTIRNDLIRSIRKNSTLSLNEIGNLFGGLSESAISKILSR